MVYRKWNELFMVNWYISKKKLWKYQIKNSTIPTLFKNFDQISQTWSKVNLWNHIFVPIEALPLSICIYRALSFAKNALSLQIHPTELLLFEQQTTVFEKYSKLYINRANSQIGQKCDFRYLPRITFEAVAEAMFGQFD